jgi:hypothetical protein
MPKRPPPEYPFGFPLGLTEWLGIITFIVACAVSAGALLA